MSLITNPSIVATLFLFVPALAITSIASTTSSTFSQSTASNLPQQNSLKDSCEIRATNYITSTVPQQCLKNTWNASIATGVDHIPGLAEVKENLAQFITVVGSNITSSAIKEVIQEFLTDTAAEAGHTQEPVPGLVEDQSVFLSFEEWKKQTLEKAEQKDHNNGQRKLADAKNREFESFQKNKDYSADDGTTRMKFSSPKSATMNTETGKEKLNSNEPNALRVEEKRESYRSKDAGKTCKERLSYASFDAGATVLKTHPGAKNAKNILTENKDSYMLTECSVENKFLIIELSEDIWIDTVVLANYEFFSSMIRTFRISVSDRYPVKIEKWKEVGTFEARNSREIQAFLVENPQIWARYIRFEFLDHYGTEYYCPLSLVRVHGTRMLESWKETEAAGEDEDTEEDLSFEETNGVIEETAIDVTNKGDTTEADHGRTVEASSHKSFTQYISDPVSGKRTSRRDPGYYIFKAGQPSPPEPVCFPSEANSKNVVVEIIKTITVNSSMEFMPTGISSSLTEPDTELTFSTIKGSETNMISGFGPDLVSPSKVFHTDTQVPSSSDLSQISHSSQGKPSSIASESSYNKNISRTPTISKNKNSTQTISSSSSLPTIQESFFKAVSRRLTLLESNSTLSLAYISEATSHLHQAFAALSRNITRAQLNKTTVFLDTINDTVLSELRGFRQQFDEIWKSTVISLESQKDESRRETLAVSERLNILAQEVVWQRRMSIVQSVLLILCLGIVIFSRVSTSSENLYIRPRSRASTFSL
ncbi:putative sad1 unc domain protein [Golovinomyces cichoracearum]|uniref:Putative sad1 unc domain protein n=1 Tax=Golovinomyces cichoracearum TaxID=62708 RepID=A0A420IYQ9_9PEZI|nr:putative sad1 unc domain protein [Golovinomyces cichoracearum]